MLIVGLTGGIGSGKSEVARRLADRGAVIIDSDLIAREVVEPGSEGLSQVVAAFGDEVLAADGTLDRERLAATVFGDDDARTRLNGILHPLIGARAMQQIADATERDPDAIVVQDVPLLVEAGAAERFEAVIVVDVPPETQLSRLTELRGMTEADARARMTTQASREQRRAAATYLIDNTGDLEALDRRVDEVWAELKCRSTGVR